ncbi:MAG TPA: MBL fold metallo-hydrolase [Alphaproteobacteria bacterium]|nr:MBL fold metallo-hydrolase [Alphaproteobacteria bacterium]
MFHLFAVGAAAAVLATGLATVPASAADTISPNADGRAHAGHIPLQTAQAKPAKRSITKIKGNLYRFQNNFHFSVFAVTPKGIIATDPINAGAARWLKAELKKRFNQPVKYLIYSHDHPDHSSGGEVFADTATVVAHANAKRVIVGEKRPTAVPNITFRRRLTIELGGTVVHLRYLGPNHSDNMIVMHFPAERVLFAVDFIPVKTLAFRTLGDSYLKGWIGSLRRVERMNFDILVPGHGQVGTRQHVTMFREYLVDLRNGVLGRIRQGQPLDQIKKELLLAKYKDWFWYKRMRAENVEGMYRLIQANRRGNPRPQ